MKKVVKMIDVIILILICVVIGGFGQVYMKLGVTKLGGVELKDLISKRLVSIIFDKYVFIGIILYTITTLLWFVILSKADLSFVYPLAALGYIVTALLAKFYFHEEITLLRWFGILLIIGGAYLVIKS